MCRKSTFWLVVLIVLGLTAVAALARAQSAEKSARGAQATQAPIAPGLEIRRLILKDGSYQPIRNYELKGDRVRYYSSERFEWEEIPFSLIDWPATEKFAREGGDRPNSTVAREVDAEEQAERKREQELSPEVAAGIRLPFQGGVFLLDVYNRQPQLNELVQNGGEIKRNTGRNILRATVNPIASAKQSIELKGAHAQVQSHVTDPVIYVNVSTDDSADSGAQGQAAGKTANAPELKDRFRIVRLDSDAKKNMRVIGNLKIAIYGKVSEEQKVVPAKVEVFSGPWLKITPTDALAAGEYAVVELLKNNQMNLYVWDFGVNPNASPNPGAWRPAPSLTTPARTDTPALQLHTNQ